MTVEPQIIVEIPFCDCNVYTDFDGHQQLLTFYSRAKQYYDTNIRISFKNIHWLDANMASLFGAIMHVLRKENRLSFNAYLDDISKFGVLFRNGFLQPEGDKILQADIKETVLPFMEFVKDDKSGFIEYINQNIMTHRGMLPLGENVKEQIKDDLIELMSNVNYHSNTIDPFFVCGQYYPYNKCFKLTLVDVGEGFLPKIKKLTEDNIQTDIEAIYWVLSGKTTKPPEELVPGGLGIKNIYNYCKQNNGVFSIATGDGYWSSELEKTTLGGFRRLPLKFAGTTINLHFKH